MSAPRSVEPNENVRANSATNPLEPDPRASGVVNVSSPSAPKDFYLLSWLVAVLGGVAFGFAFASEYILVVRLGSAGFCALVATGPWLVFQQAQVARFLAQTSDKLDRGGTLPAASYAVLWRIVERSAALPWLLSNDDLLFDVLDRVSSQGTLELPVRACAALKRYARREVEAAIDKSFKNLHDIVRSEQRRVKHQSWLALAAISVAVLVATLGCLASFGYVPSLSEPVPKRPGLTFVRVAGLAGTWSSTTAVVGLSAVLLTAAAMALRTLERHHVRALSIAERLRFASGLKASCGLDLHPFLARFAPPSTAEMMRLVRDPKSYDLVPLSEVVERPIQEIGALRDIVPPMGGPKT